MQAPFEDGNVVSFLPSSHSFLGIRITTSTLGASEITSRIDLCCFEALVFLRVWCPLDKSFKMPLTGFLTLWVSGLVPLPFARVMGAMVMLEKGGEWIESGRKLKTTKEVL